MQKAPGSMPEASAVSRLHRQPKGTCRGTPVIMARPYFIPDQPKPKAAARQRRHAGPPGPQAAGIMAARTGDTAMRPMQEQPGGAESQCHEASDRTPGCSHGKHPQAFRDTGPDKPSSTPPAAEYGRKEGRRPPAVGRLARAGNPASRTVQRNASWRGGQPGLCADKECRGRGRGQPEGQAAGAAAGRPKGQGRRFLGMAQTLREWGSAAPAARAIGEERTARQQAPNNRDPAGHAHGRPAREADASMRQAPRKYVGARHGNDPETA